MQRWHIETEYRTGGLANISAYPSQQAAWDHIRANRLQREKYKEQILLASLTDTDESDEDPLVRISILEELDSMYVHHVRPCEGNSDCTACHEAGLI